MIAFHRTSLARVHSTQAKLMSFCSAALCSAILLTTDTHAQNQAYIIVQQSPLAGFQYYAGSHLWERMTLGDTLTLQREANNRHDSNAVRIEWQGQHLGYIPRRENTDVARQIDAGAAVKARIVRLMPSRNPWQRILFEVYVDLNPETTPQ